MIKLITILNEVKVTSIYDENGVIIRSAIKPYLLKTILKLYPKDKIGNRYAPTLSKKSSIVDEYLSSEDFNYGFFDKKFDPRTTPITKLVPIIVKDFKNWVGDINEIQIIGGNMLNISTPKDFRYGKNIRECIYNCIAANPNISERQVAELIMNKFRQVHPKTIGDNIRKTPNIRKKIVINPKTKRKIWVYSVVNTPAPETSQQEELSLKQYINKDYEIKNINYYEQLLNNSSLSPKIKLSLQNIISSIKNQGGLASKNQFINLQKLKNGMLSEIQIANGILGFLNRNKEEIFDHLHLEEEELAVIDKICFIRDPEYGSALLSYIDDYPMGFAFSFNKEDVDKIDGEEMVEELNIDGKKLYVASYMP